ncbi:hypothetical protein BBD42_05405 [Paenibacillus sp. BIHB 4019]|uniref:Uncharacterized protein n=1 Tax=Paenibacillus sp. BIHB 4019 TaxID=1870819 RepID=A0A1B2DE35_9BACL|nr:hypothetical protein BBD42_05405 [Paenibacillus sp. BIHB 4019]
MPRKGASRSYSSKNYSHKSNGNKSYGNKSKGDRSCSNKSGGSNSCIRNILKGIGVGTPNIRIHFDSTSHVGVFMGVANGCAILNVKGVVTYIKILSITAVEIGVKVTPVRNGKWKCKKT